MGTEGERPKGSAKLYIRLNKPPNPGTCKLSGTTGLATVSIFKMEFSGWTDPEKEPLRDYSVYSKLVLNFKKILSRILKTLYNQYVIFFKNYTLKNANGFK